MICELNKTKPQNDGERLVKAIDEGLKLQKNRCELFFEILADMSRRKLLNIKFAINKLGICGLSDELLGICFDDNNGVNLISYVSLFYVNIYNLLQLKSGAAAEFKFCTTMN